MNIGALVVTYNPTEKILNGLIGKLKNDCEEIIIIDNNSESKEIIKAISKDVRIKVIFNNENVGLAKAQNQGIEFLKNKPLVKKIIVFDQDSNPDLNMVRNLNNEFEQIKKIDSNIAAVGPRFIDTRSNNYFPFIQYGFFRTNKIFKNKNHKTNHIKVDLLISSGTLLSIESLDKIGLMDESLFIDCIDTEWCMRAIKKGFNLYGVFNAEMFHTIGDNLKTIKIPIIGQKNILIHSPIRKYYMYRNKIHLVKKKHIFFKWKLQSILKIIPSVVTYIVFVVDRKENSKYIFKGLIHGLKGKMHKL
ncbi:glycosyltransferase family 2 protein [Exiguobacterium sp. s138]|uniref:glycosyltransferase family 2 protein n=1 Tax=Exiguobacterium sp. s138 TaxID=2751202 RepID=UPI001BE5CA75